MSDNLTTSAKGASAPEYRALAHLLEPFFCEERTSWFPFDRYHIHHWLRRLCQ